MALSPEQLALWALQNREQALRQLDKLDAEHKLIDFITLMWSVLEPGRKFVRGWAVEALCDHLEAVSRGEIKKLLINVPPGAMKSLTTNVFWPAWEWGPRKQPFMRYISAAYAEQLTIRDNRRCLKLIRSPLYQSLWGDRFVLDPDQQSKTKFDNLSTGWKLATSVSGAATGERGDRFIIDDPHNVKEGESEAKRVEALQWFTEVVPSRVNDPDKSVFIVIMQRVHEDDVSGHIINAEGGNYLGYEHLCLPMEYEAGHPHKTRTSLNFVDPRKEEGELLWPERFSRKYLDEDLKPMLASWGGEYAVSGQMQQRPAPRGGGMFKIDSLQFINAHELPRMENVVRAWDLAATKDGHGAYTVAVKMGRARGNYYVLDVRRFRGSSQKVYDEITSCAATDGRDTVHDLPQDPGQAGKAQKHWLAQLLAGHTFHITVESGSKEDRAKPYSSQVESGNVYLVRAPWTDAYRAELGMFPAGKFKDQVDASSRAFTRLVAKRPKSGGYSGGMVIGDTN